MQSGNPPGVASQGLGLGHEAPTQQDRAGIRCCNITITVYHCRVSFEDVFQRKRRRGGKKGTWFTRRCPYNNISVNVLDQEPAALTSIHTLTQVLLFVHRLCFALLSIL